MTEIFKPETIDFKTAEKLIAVAVKMSYPSMIFIGRNGIGKTWMLSEWVKKSPNSIAMTDTDTGALRSFDMIDYLVKRRIKTVFIPEFMSLLSRKSDVRASAFSSIVETMDFYRAHSLSYQTVKQRNWQNYMEQEIPRLNYIVACDYVGMGLCKQSQYIWNFLNRCAIFFIETSKYSPSFKCKFEGEKMKISKYPIKSLQMRQQEMFNNICTGLESLGHEGYIPMYFWDIYSHNSGDFSDVCYYDKSGKTTKYGVRTE